MGLAIPNALFVVIPAYNEAETLPQCLASLCAANRPNVKVNVIVVLNYGSNDHAKVKHDTAELEQWCRTKASELNSDDIRLITLTAYDLDPKLKGAGFARKAGMDQVLAFSAQHGNTDSVVVSLDADTTVAPNYFEAIGNFFSDRSRVSCSIRFEHPLDGENLHRNNAIALYELHLRYYRQALLAAGFPHAIHTVGSAMAFRCAAYAKAGGMTQKQAGEDFYFLHKIITQGGFGEINDTLVYPSARPSLRVIFGTGATVHKMETDGLYAYQTYNLQSFIDLSKLFGAVAAIYNAGPDNYQKTILELPGRVRSFLVNNGFEEILVSLMGNCASAVTFKKRFFEVFNAFVVIKYLNFTHEHFLEKPDVCEASTLLLEQNHVLDDPFADVFGLLLRYREIDKTGIKLSLMC